MVSVAIEELIKHFECKDVNVAQVNTEDGRTFSFSISMKISENSSVRVLIFVELHLCTLGKITSGYSREFRITEWKKRYSQETVWQYYSSRVRYVRMYE